MSIYDHRVAHLDKTKSNLLNEAYIGKTPLLIEVEKKIHDYRSKKDLSIYNCSSTSKEILDINRLIEKQFGMEIFALKILPTEAIDAYNLPVSCRFDMEKENMRDYVEGNIKTGYRFRKNNGLCCIVCLSYGLMADKRYTDGQILACILHEIGHNFGDCLYDELRVYNKAIIKEYKASLIQDIFMKVIISICALPLLPFELYGIISDLNVKKQNTNKYLLNKEKRNKKRKPGSGRVNAFLAGFKGTITDKLDLHSVIKARSSQDYIDAITNSRKSISDEQKEEIRKSPSRKGEVIADKFASIYGYGIEFSELLMNFDNISGSREYKAARKANPKTKKLNDEFEKALFDMNDFDCHPAGIQRMNTLLKTLKAECEKEDIDPKVKEELLYQINQIQNNIDDMSDASKKIYSIDKAQALYLNYLKNNVPDAIAADIESNIDDMLDKALEKQENRRKRK